MTKLRLAYLAPELPGLSATFVYKEIFALEKLGFSILPVSVHRPNGHEQDEKLRALSGRTQVLYQTPFLQLLVNCLWCVVNRPAYYFSTLWLLLSDMPKANLGFRGSLGLAFRFLMAATLAKKLVAGQVEHLHIHFAHVPSDIGMYAARIAGISYSVTAHANDLFERGYLLTQKVQRAKFFATISQFNVQWLQAQGVPTENICVIRCGVSAEEFPARDIAPDNTPKVIGALGRLVEKKGFDLLIDAASRLRQSNIPFRLQIVGDGPLRDVLTEQIADAKLDDVVEFLGSKPNRDVANWLQTLDIFALPCQQDRNGDMDGIPVALMEAMLRGIPVVSTDISGLPELVINGVTGFVAKPSAEKLADALAAALQCENAQLDIYVNAARQQVLREFDLDLNAKKLRDAIVIQTEAAADERGPGDTVQG